MNTTDTQADPVTQSTAPVPVRLDFDSHAAGFSRALAHLDKAATKELDRVSFDPRLRGLVAPHRHSGEVHAFNLSGTREVLGTGEIVGPGDYGYEPAGTVDAWQAVGEEPCVVHIKVVGAVEYLDDAGEVIDTADSASQCAAYLAWCREHGVDPAPQILNRDPQH